MGVYWGLYNLTERIDDAFLTTHFGHENWDLIPTEEQERIAWDEFSDRLIDADLRAAAQYEQVLQQLDIENFTSFIILHLWAGNIDWGGQNWYAARMRAGPDARWRFFVWDAELTFGLRQETDANEEVPFGPVAISSAMQSALASLLTSPQYQVYFTAQVERHLAGALATESARDRLAALGTELRPVMAAEAARWLPDREPAMMVAQWEAALQRVADSLDISEQRLRHLSDPETLRQLLPLFSAVGDPAPLPPDTRIAILVDHPAELTAGDTARRGTLNSTGRDGQRDWCRRRQSA